LATVVFVLCMTFRIGIVVAAVQAMRSSMYGSLVWGTFDDSVYKYLQKPFTSVLKIPIKCALLKF